MTFESRQAWRRVHDEAVVVDTHCDSLAPVLRGERSLHTRSDLGNLDFPRLIEGGITGQVIAIGLHDFGPSATPPTQRFLQVVDAFYRELEAGKDLAMLATTADDILAAKQQGKVAAILGMEDGAPLAGELSVLRMLYRLGLRVLTLVWGPANEIGDGVSRRSDPGGPLTPFGISLVREMNRLGMVIDVSHLNEQGFWDVIKTSQDPIIASHSNPRSLYDHPRNLSDAQLRAIAAGGGVVHSVFTFLDTDPSKLTLERVLDHIEYMVNKIGPEHVGIGSDFDGIPSGMPAGLADATCYPRITEGLVKRGFPAAAVRAILGQNFLRVFTAVAG